MLLRVQPFNSDPDANYLAWPYALGAGVNLHLPSRLLNVARSKLD
jgi:hypothetical protein